MMLVAGIDGGQSSTTAAIADATGRVLARGRSGPSDHIDESPHSRRFADAMENAIADAMRAAQLPVGTELAAIVAGISGFEGTLHGIEPRLPSERVRYLHDAPIALAGALAGEPGLLVLSGTGSVCYAEIGGRSAMGGGWGYLFGDEGSSFALARAAIASAALAEDRGQVSALGDAALAYFAAPTLRALVRRVAVREISRPYLATFARVVCDAARIGSSEAVAIVAAAARDLASLAAHTVGRVRAEGAFPTALVGGTFGSAYFREAVEAALAEELPWTLVVPPRYEPVLGAVLLALGDAGIEELPHLSEAVTT